MSPSERTIAIGSYNELVVARESEFGVYLAVDGEEVLLPNKYVPPGTKVGQTLRVFVYTDSEDRPVATLRTPAAAVGEFACMEVVDVNRFGAFLDWGLEKDLFVPFAEQSKPMVKGQRHVVRVCLDARSGRVIGVTKLQRYLARSPRGLGPGKRVRLLVCEVTPLGYSVIIDGAHRGLLYKDQVEAPLAVGAQCDGYVQRIRPDRLIDVSLKPQGFKAVIESKPEILNLLEQAGGFLPYHDKTDSAVIEREFGMSKKAFKKVIGSLYRDRRIELGDDGIRLPARKGRPGVAAGSVDPVPSSGHVRRKRTSR